MITSINLGTSLTKAGRDAAKRAMELGLSSGGQQQDETPIALGLPETEEEVQKEGDLPSLPSLPSDTKDASSQLKDADPMTLMAGALQSVGRASQKEGRFMGMEKQFGMVEDEYGLTPGEMAPGTIQQMMAVVDQAMVDPAQERLNTVTDMINSVHQMREDARNTAERNMEFLIDSGMWNDLNWGEKQQLWEAVGLPGEARNISESFAEEGMSTVDLQRTHVPGETPERGYQLWTQPTAPKDFVEELEREWRAEGKLGKDERINPDAAQAEWTERRKRIVDDQDSAIENLPRQDRADVRTLNAALKREYERLKTEYENYYELQPALRERQEEPESPEEAIVEMYEDTIRQNQDIADYIKLPF